MKVESKRGSGTKAVMTAATGVAVMVTLIAGAGVVPTRIASAQVAEVGSGKGSASDSVLPPAVDLPKADEIREPSGLEAIEAEAPAVRKPTAIKPKPAPRPKSALKPAAPKPAAPRSAAAPAQTAAAPAVDTTGWKSARVSWYGPGFYGNTMAGGGKLTPSSMVVAHRSLAFGTRIEFSYNGRTCVAVVQDRGPHVAGRVFDLGPGTAKTLGFSGVGTVQYRILN